MKSKLLSSIYLLLIIPTNFNISQSDFKSLNNMANDNLESIYLGAGCFWCVEAIFQQVAGVVEVIPGYCGGLTKNPTYNEVCSGKTGHVEVAKIIYNNSLVNLDHILEVFWKTHDPTTLNRQGNDIGTQYRSAIFYNNENQKKISEGYKNELISNKVFENSIVTEILKIDIFYPAENYHHNYYNNNKSQGYCQYVIQPKIEKYKKIFNNK
ncbi:peptide-methionine (S)-S-oxide reductase MsrA [bacterium]|jgi:peptide-methionine (S)-S-oxide reductase|nr:peptide-methionine (S)-S-oxide reductase MsrA [bacterium]